MSFLFFPLWPPPFCGVINRKAGQSQERTSSSLLHVTWWQTLFWTWDTERNQGLPFTSGLRAPTMETDTVTTVVQHRRIEDQECWEEQKTELEKVRHANEVGKEIVQANGSRYVQCFAHNVSFTLHNDFVRQVLVTCHVVQGPFFCRVQVPRGDDEMRVILIIHP